jgi:hypothetical protein
VDPSEDVAYNTSMPLHTALTPDGRYRVEWGTTRSRTDLYDDDTYYEVRVFDVDPGKRLKTFHFSHARSAAGTHGEQLRGVSLSDDSRTLTIHLLGAADETIELDSLKFEVHQEMHPDGDLKLEWAEKVLGDHEKYAHVCYEAELRSTATGKTFFVATEFANRMKENYRQRGEAPIARMAFSQLDGFLVCLREDGSLKLFHYDSDLPKERTSEFRSSDNGWFVAKLVRGNPAPPGLDHELVDIVLVWDEGANKGPLVFSDFDLDTGKWRAGYDGRRLVGFRFAPRNRIRLMFSDGTEEEQWISHPRIVVEDAIASPCGRFLADRIEGPGPYGPGTRQVTIRFATIHDGVVVGDWRHWWPLDAWDGEPRPGFESCSFDPGREPLLRVFLRDGSQRTVSLARYITP